MSKMDSRGEPAPTASFWRSLKIVAWSFLGIRKSSEFREDMARVNPFHLILAGLAGVVMLVMGLIVLVNWVVAR